MLNMAFDDDRGDGSSLILERLEGSPPCTFFYFSSNQNYSFDRETSSNVYVIN